MFELDAVSLCGHAIVQGMEAQVEQAQLPVDNLSGGNDLGDFEEDGTVDNRGHGLQALDVVEHHGMSKFQDDLLEKSDEKCSQDYSNALGLSGGDGNHHQEPGVAESDLPPYGELTLSDVGKSLDEAKARLLNIIIEHFITHYTIPAVEPQVTSLMPLDPLKAAARKRKSRELAFEGDPRYLLPLTYVTNLYETLVMDCNKRISTIPGLEGRSFALALEAAGGLYRKLVEKYPKNGSPVTFKRREMASALEAREKFPMLVTGDEKRTRFIVIHGLEIVERPESISPEDAEWFKKVTGRHQAAVSPKDYMFFSARTKIRRPSQPREPLSLPSMSLHPPRTIVQQKHMQMIHPMRMMLPPMHSAPPHGPPPPPPPPPVSSSSPNMAIVVQQVPHFVTTTPQSPGHLAKFCDECGAAYVRDSSKFCSECGTRRPGS